MHYIFDGKKVFPFIFHWKPKGLVTKILLNFSQLFTINILNGLPRYSADMAFYQNQKAII